MSKEINRRTTSWPAALALTALVIACSSGEPTDESELSEEKLAMLERWQKTEFIYDDSAAFPFQCQYINPNDGMTYQFECDIVIIGLIEGVMSADVGDLVDAISGTIARDRSDLALPSIDVEVAPRTEKSAILTAIKDDRTRYATPNVLGPGVP